MEEEMNTAPPTLDPSQNQSSSDAEAEVEPAPDLVPRAACLSSHSLHLEEHITFEKFSNIMQDFHRLGRTSEEDSHKPLKTTKISTEDFQVTMSKLLGRPPDDDKIILLCNKIDTDGAGFIDADEFCSYLLQQLKEKDPFGRRMVQPFSGPPRFRHNAHSKETICRLSLATGPMRFLSVSKDGVVATWNLQLHLQSGVRLNSNRGGTGKSKGSLLVTDFAIMANCNKMVLSTSSRELVFTDISTTTFKCQYRVHDLPAVPLCLDYYYDKENPGSKSYLLSGDISGSVTVFTFHTPQVSLFSGGTKDEDDKPLYIGYNTLGSHSKVLSVQHIPRLHSDWVVQMRYVPHNHTFYSCSCTSSDSLIQRDITHKMNNYVFKIRKGVLCFDYCHSLDLLVTGSLDHMVSVWNPYVPAKPVAILDSHLTTILSVIISKENGLIFSLSKDLVLCAWDLREYTLIQTLTVKFPFTQRLPEFGPTPMSLLPNSQTLVVICNEYIAELKLGLTVSRQTNSNFFTSHSQPLCGALYNRHFRQVVSACEGGVVSIWDVDSGCQVLNFRDCHGSDELTAMNLDSTGRRLVTGSRAGEMKVWQMNGTCIKHLRRDSYSEVTGIVHIMERRLFLSVGWDKKITTFQDDPDIYDIVPEESWNGEAHSDDILCVAYSMPHYLATGSFDGTIKIWNTDLERLLMQFQSSSKRKLNQIKREKSAACVSIENTSSQKSWASLRSASSRPASRRLATRSFLASAVVSPLHVPIDEVLFLSRRIRSRDKGMAALVTSEAGIAKFWDLFGYKKPVGSFAMTELEDECVIAMTTDASNEYLLAGDTAGFIAVFNIKNYCTTDEAGSKLDPAVRWRGHSVEVVSIDYVPHDTQALVLSASGDGTVRLWSLQGHWIGTFGQKQPWDLQSPATFEHPNTPWGDMWKKSLSQTSAETVRSASPAKSATPSQTPAKPSLPDLKELRHESKSDLTWPSVSSMSSGTVAELTSSLVDRSLGGGYTELTHKRMDDRHRRRVHLSKIGVKTAVEKFGSVCSPFHSLELSKVEEIRIPKDVSLALGKGKKQSFQSKKNVVS